MSKFPNLVYLIVVFILSFPLQLSAQSSVRGQDEELHKIMKDHAELLEKNPDTALANLKKLRDQSLKSEPEKALQYIREITDILARTKGDNHELLKESEIGLKFAKKLNDFRTLIYLHLHRSAAYSSEGLLDLSYRELMMAIPYANKILDPNLKHLSFTQIYGSLSSYYSIKADTINVLVYANKSIESLNQVIDTSADISSKVRLMKGKQFEDLAYFYFSKKQFDSSEYYLLEAYKLYNHKDSALTLYDKTGIVRSLSEFYYKRKNYRKAIQYAQIGLSIRKNNEPLTKKDFYNVLYKSYLETNQIDSSKYFSKLYTIVDDSLQHATNTGLNATFERQNKNKELTHRTSVQKIIGIGLVIFIILSILTFYWLRINKKRLHQKYDDLIAKLSEQTIEQPIEEHTSLIFTEESSNSKDTEESDSSIGTEQDANREGIYIPGETVAVLLKKLEKFERSAKYIKKNVTLSSMANDMDTNTRYISEIIKEYRGKNFNNYINGLRIEFITKKLYDDPQFRKYKVAYLAEYSGFASGTNFTTIFKKETGMTPSYFISQLEKRIESDHPS